MSWLFTSGGQSIEASASVLPMSTLESAKKVCIQSCRIRRVGTFLVASEEVLKNRAVTKAKL